MENQRGTAVPDIEESVGSAEESRDSAAKEIPEGQCQENPETQYSEAAQKTEHPISECTPGEPLQPLSDAAPGETAQPSASDAAPGETVQPSASDAAPGETVQPSALDAVPGEIVQPSASDAAPKEIPQPAPPPVLEEIRQAIADLQQSFDDKIAQDKHKNALFDQMHRELVQYQNGVVDKNTETMAMDIIQLIDSTRNHIRIYEEKEGTPENYDRLLRLVKGLVEDLQDVLYRQSIEAYQVAGEEVDVRRQKIIQTLETDDPAQDNAIAVRVADGYEKGEKVLRPERIKIYKYRKKPTDADNK